MRPVSADPSRRSNASRISSSAGSMRSMATAVSAMIAEIIVRRCRRLSGNSSSSLDVSVDEALGAVGTERPYWRAPAGDRCRRTTISHFGRFMARSAVGSSPRHAKLVCLKRK